MHYPFDMKQLLFFNREPTKGGQSVNAEPLNPGMIFCVFSKNRYNIYGI